MFSNQNRSTVKKASARRKVAVDGINMFSHIFPSKNSQVVLIRGDKPYKRIFDEF
jgi:hypothetical protein